MMIRANVPSAMETQLKLLLDTAAIYSKTNELPKLEATLLKAWSLLPEPKLSWEYHPQIIARKLLNCYTLLKDKDNAQKWMSLVREAYEAPFLGDDPAVDFWEAQMNLDLGMQEEAFSAFHNLYKKFKKRPFKGRDSKYLDFYFSKMKEKTSGI